MKVLKFGGTSVGSAKNIKKVIEIVKSSCENDQIAVVVSAVGGITDKLMSASQKAIDKYKESAAYFKEVNDSYGHAAGDQVLKTLAQLLKGRFRGSDVDEN